MQRRHRRRHASRRDGGPRACRRRPRCREGSKPRLPCAAEFAIEFSARQQIRHFRHPSPSQGPRPTRTGDHRHRRYGDIVRDGQGGPELTAGCRGPGTSHLRAHCGGGGQDSPYSPSSGSTSTRSVPSDLHRGHRWRGHLPQCPSMSSGCFATRWRVGSGFVDCAPRPAAGARPRRLRKSWRACPVPTAGVRGEATTPTGGPPY